MKYILYLIFFAEIATAQKLPDLIPYRKGDKWGYADSTGKIIIQPIYNGVDTMHNGVLIAHGADKITYLLDSKGKILFGREKFAIMYVKYDRDSLLYLMDYTKEDPNHDINNEYYGYLSLKGQIVVPPKYHSIP